MAQSGSEGHTTGADAGAPDVFISYASQDAPIADAVVVALETHGLRCWIAPRDVTPGRFYADEIVHAIDAAKAIVLILSQNAAASPHVLREVERAASKRHAVISLRTDKAPLPAGLEYFLNTSQWLDASSGETVRALPKLVSAVQLAIHVPAVMPLVVPAVQAPVPAMSARSLKKVGSIVASVIGLGLAVFAADRLWLSHQKAAATPIRAPTFSPSILTPAAPTVPEKSVAVLPFTDMSEKKDQEYFSDGLSEEVLDLLSRIPELHVVARTSAFSFKGKSDDIPTIARKLLVANVLEGSVRRSGNHLRITTQLVRADNGYHLWSQTYDRKLDDIFKIQDDIAGSVVQALKVVLLEGSPPKATETQSTEAYTLYVQARSMLIRANTQGEYEKVADYLQTVLKLDPKFAPAWALLSLEHSYRATSSTSGPAAQDIEEARRAATQALALDPSLAEAHHAMSIILSGFDWDWIGAQAEAQRALALDPGKSHTALPAGILALALGQYDEALTFFQTAAATDPLNSSAQAWLGWLFGRDGKYSEALGATRKALDLDSGSMYGHFIVASMLLKTGDSAGALTEIDLGSDYERSLSRAYVFHALGRKADADLAIAAFEKKYAEGDAYHIAGIHAFRGESDLAFAWLDRAYRQRDTGLEFVKCDPLFENLQADPRYKAFLRKMKLPE
jgi:TolB-like protein